MAISMETGGGIASSVWFAHDAVDALGSCRDQTLRELTGDGLHAILLFASTRAIPESQRVVMNSVLHDGRSAGSHTCVSARHTTSESEDAKVEMAASGGLHDPFYGRAGLRSWHFLLSVRIVCFLARPL